MGDVQREGPEAHQFDAVAFVSGGERRIDPVEEAI
jgi:hypothetical protein